MLDQINAVNDVFWLYIVIPLLALTSLAYMFATKGVQFRLLGPMFRGLREDPGEAMDGRKATSAFGAFAVSSAARVGTGNIVGVSGAIAAGGPGAVFWMWILSIVVAASAFAESTLAQVYKTRAPQGYKGGPAYYMKYGMNKAWMGGLFAIVLILTYPLTFNMVQANTFVGAVNTSARDAGSEGLSTPVTVAIALGLAAVVGVVVYGGLRRIAHTAGLLVPVMAAIYFIIGTIVVAINFDSIPSAFADIVGSAFGWREIGGATLGTAFIIGAQRGMFSNEAGMGSAPNAGATASVSHPVKQGLTQAFGVYFDTLLLCTISAMIILTTNPVFGDAAPDNMVATGVGDTLGSWALQVVALILLLFTFTSCLGNYYYGEANIKFISERPAATHAMRALVIVGAFVGGVAAFDTVWGLANITMGLMAVINLIALIALFGVLLKVLADYDAQRRTGADPVFTRDRVAGVRGVQVWESEPEPEPVAERA